jgi:hypothetical protein
MGVLSDFWGLVPYQSRRQVSPDAEERKQIYIRFLAKLGYHKTDAWCWRKYTQGNKP